MPPPGAHQSLMVLAVSDVARSALFYERSFGWRREVDLLPVYVQFENGPGEGALALHERGRFRHTQPGSIRSPLHPPRRAGGAD